MKCNPEQIKSLKNTLPNIVNNADELLGSLIIYISGGMSGIKDLNFPAFYAAQELLESRGHTVVNPAEIGKNLIIPSGLSKEELYLFYLRADIEAMLVRGCNTIYLLKGWETSRGAWVELKTAISLGFKILYEFECEFHTCGCDGGNTFVLHNTEYDICEICNGTAVIPSEIAGWRKLGKVLRTLRASKNLTLSDVKIKHKVSIVDLSAAENGRVDPQPYINKLEGKI